MEQPGSSSVSDSYPYAPPSPWSQLVLALSLCLWYPNLSHASEDFGMHQAGLVSGEGFVSCDLLTPDCHTPILNPRCMSEGVVPVLLWQPGLNEHAPRHLHQRLVHSLGFPVHLWSVGTSQVLQDAFLLEPVAEDL